MKTYIHKQPKKPKVWGLFDEADPDDFRLDAWFIEYCARVRGVLTDELITVGEIRRRLGHDECARYLGDALDAIVRNGEAYRTEGEYLDRYKWSSPEPVKKEVAEPFRTTHTNLFSKGEKRIKPDVDSIYDNPQYGVK